MHLKGEELSLQARVVLNTSLLRWLNDNIDDIGETCLVAELFTGRHKTTGIVTLRNRLIEHLRSSLLVLCGNNPKHCEIADVEVCTTDEEMELKKEGWKPPSTSMLAAILGMDHSSFVKRKVKRG